jgi:DNA-binding MltR family transcriptional regulator
MMWHLRSDEEAKAIHELDNTSDRAAAIVAGAILDDRLEETLKGLMVDHQKNASTSVHNNMFRSSGPLGSFSAKVDLCLMIGLFSPEAWRDLDYVREIRNEFAHRVGAHDFGADRIRGLCGNLKEFEKHLFPMPEREEDIPDDGEYRMLTSDDEDIPAQLANPRMRFLLCVRFYLSALSHLWWEYDTAAEPPRPLHGRLC